MNSDIQSYIDALEESDQQICGNLVKMISENLPEAESKIWHAHPVWFLDENPVVGFSRQKKGIRLMFWSGKSFDEEKLNVKGAKFQDASVFFNSNREIDEEDVKRWLGKTRQIQWDYKNIVKRKGVLIRLK